MFAASQMTEGSRMAGFVWMTFGFGTAEVLRQHQERITLPREQLLLAGAGRLGAPKGAGSPKRLALALCLLQRRGARQHCSVSLKAFFLS